MIFTRISTKYKMLQEIRPSKSKEETVALVFAIINIIITVSMTFYSLGALAYEALKLSQLAESLARYTGSLTMDPHVLSDHRSPVNVEDVIGTALTLFGYVVLVIFSLIAVLFAVILIEGLVKTKPQHVQAYLMYGTGMIVLGLLMPLFFILTVRFTKENIVLSTSSYAVTLIYWQIIKVLHNVHKKMEKDCANSSTGLHIIYDKKIMSLPTPKDMII